MSTKTIIFRDGINLESVSGLIGELENSKKGVDNDGIVADIPESIILYFSTPGGELSSMNILINYINEYELPMEIRVFEECSSAGFIFALSCGRDISIDDGTFAVVHIGEAFLSSRSKRIDGHISNFLDKEFSRTNDKMIELYKKAGLTNEEIKTLKTGKDVFLNQERIENAIACYRINNRIDMIKEDIENKTMEIDLMQQEIDMLSEQSHLFVSKEKNNKKGNKNYDKKNKR